MVPESLVRWCSCLLHSITFLHHVSTWNIELCVPSELPQRKCCTECVYFLCLSHSKFLEHYGDAFVVCSDLDCFYDFELGNCSGVGIFWRKWHSKTLCP